MFFFKIIPPTPQKLNFFKPSYQNFILSDSFNLVFSHKYLHHHRKWVYFFNESVLQHFKFFFLGSRNFYINTNSLNLLLLGTVGFNNFFFYFFNESWLKNNVKSQKLLSLLKHFLVKTLFFFDTSNLKLIFFFKKNFFFTSGLIQTRQKNVLFDFPLYTPKLNFISIYITYLFLLKCFTNYNPVWAKNFPLNPHFWLFYY